MLKKKQSPQMEFLAYVKISKYRFNVPIQHGEQKNEFEIGTFVTNFIYDHSCR